MSPVHDSYGKQVGAGLGVPASSKLGGLPVDTLGEQCDPRIRRGCMEASDQKPTLALGGPKTTADNIFARSHITTHTHICSYSHNIHMCSHTDTTHAYTHVHNTCLHACTQSHIHLGVPWAVPRKKGKTPASMSCFSPGPRVQQAPSDHVPTGRAEL